ncbi:hypothetical protein [Pseudoalteromonas piscicida]|uniref:Uncharacterized protein n=2 Tax=Pseudoalteromonas piscicida TaxID=43662 RepID=A0A2A5JLJ2_PSEO7|nr:hypothetical protein [Pseudoalteromonas piscicida]PCK30121.1 hypothetical protein CEX98_19200 [Pseudoalteromonas piscicida]
MKLQLKKTQLKALSKDKNVIADEMTPNVAGGFIPTARQYCKTDINCASEGCDSIAPNCGTQTYTCY